MELLIEVNEEDIKSFIDSGEMMEDLAEAVEKAYLKCLNKDEVD